MTSRSRVSAPHLALAAAALFVLLILSGAALRVLSLQRAMHDGWRRSLEGGVVTTQATLDEWYGERVSDAGELAASIARHSGDTASAGRNLDRLPELLAPVQRHAKFIGIWVLDGAGAVLANASGDSLRAEEREAAGIALRADSTAHSSIMPLGPRAAYLSFAAPVLPRAGAFRIPGRAAVVVLRADLVASFSPWAAVRPNAALSVLATPSARGPILVYACPEHALPVCIDPRTHVSPATPSAIALARRDTFGEFDSVDGRRVLAVTRYDRTLGWGVVRRIALKDALVPLQKEIAIEGAFFFIVLALLAVGAYAVNRNIRVRRLHEQREADARLLTIVDSSTDGLLTLDERYIITMVNGAVERMLGRPRDALIGLSVMDVVSTQRERDLRRHLDAFAASDLPHATLADDDQCVVRSESGQLIAVDARAGRAVIGDLTLFVVGLRDVSERVRVARFAEGQRYVLELIASGATATEALHVLLVAIETEAPGMRCAAYELEDDGLIAHLRTAPSFEPDLALALEDVVLGPDCEVVGTAIHRGEEVVSPDIATDIRWERARRYVLSHGVRSAAALPLRSPDGAVIGALALFFAEARHPTRREMQLARTAVHLASIALSSARDAASLRASEASFRSIVENAPAAVFRETRQGRLVSTNPAMVAMLGFPHAEALVDAAAAGALYHDAKARTQLLQSLESDDVVRGVELQWCRADGSVVAVRMNARAYRDDRGAVWLWEGFAEDVTPLRDAELALRRSERLAAVGQLISGVAHELNNPLSSIMHFAEDLLADERPADDAEALGVIRDQARRSRAIVRDLLSFVRQRDATAEPILLSGVVSATARAMRPSVEAGGTRLHVDNPGSDVVILADRAGVEQIVTNLVSNAADAASADGDVWVSTRSTEHGCLLLVEDSGPGISPDVLPRIFDPFFTTKRTGDGTGLGLSVTHGIVEQLGGRIAVEARDGGPGTRFTVFFPCIDPEALRAHVVAASAPAPASEAAAAARRAADPAIERAATTVPVLETSPPSRLALVIDDEPTIRSALRRYFVRRGWRVEEAADGAAGLAKLRELGEEVAVVVSDLRMPGVSGIELHDRLAAEHSALLQRIVFSTGDVASAEAASFVQRTHCHVLQKPFELRMLDEIIKQIVEGASPERVIA